MKRLIDYLGVFKRPKQSREKGISMNFCNLSNKVKVRPKYLLSWVTGTYKPRIFSAEIMCTLQIFGGFNDHNL